MMAITILQINACTQAHTDTQPSHGPDNEEANKHTNVTFTSCWGRAQLRRSAGREVLSIGDEVEPRDLTCAAHLNGKVGELLGFIDTTSRWIVQLDVSGAETKKVKAINLRRLAAQDVEAQIPLRPQSHFVTADCVKVTYQPPELKQGR